MIDYDLIWHSLPALLNGAWISVQIAFCAAILGLVLGTALALAETSTYRLVRFLVSVYVTLFRGTPMLVQILFVYYVLPQFGVVIDPLWAAVMAIGMNSGAYVSQTIRTGISAIPIGQIEAAKALGFSQWATMRYIVLPQAFRIALPALGNELVTLIKDSSLASIIGVMELSKEGSLIRSRTYDAFSILLAVSCIYLMLTASLTSIMKKLERKSKADVYS